MEKPIFSPARYVQDPSQCVFYHKMELPEFGLVEGAWDLRGRINEYLGNVPLAGKRALDVGTASGFLSFEMEHQGAEVLK
jgi:2-polyprenyl-3-methyl-5-hydroxy-6-metoxy-1,4-benzoquinol methylase